MEEVLSRMLKLLETLTVEKGVSNDGIDEKNINGKGKKSKLSSSDRSYLKEAFTLMAEILSQYEKKNKKDTAAKTVVKDIAKKQVASKIITTTGSVPEKKEGGGWLSKIFSGPVLMGIIGLVSLLTGLSTDGPFKGILKILSKIGIGSLVKTITKTFERFAGGLKNILKVPGRIIKSLIGGVLKGFGSLVGKIAGKVLPKGASGFLGKMMGGLMKFIKPLGKILTKVPIVGTIISIGFAISRFKNGDIRGGIIDILSGLASIIPGVGTAISIGLDLLNAYFDFSGGGSEVKKPETGGNILTDIASSIGNFLWENAKDVPILGTIRYMGEAYDAFKAGNYMDALGLLGQSIISIIPGGGLLIRGIEALMGWFGEKSEGVGKLVPNFDWMNGVKKWISTKMKSLPWSIQKALSWMGIMDDPDGSSTPPPPKPPNTEKFIKKSKDQIPRGYTEEDFKGPFDPATNRLRRLHREKLLRDAKLLRYEADKKGIPRSSAIEGTISRGVVTDIQESNKNPTYNSSSVSESYLKSGMDILNGSILTPMGELYNEIKGMNFEIPKIDMTFLKTQYKAYTTLPVLCQQILLELKRISGTGGGTSITSVTPSISIPSTPSAPMVDMPNNRGGYPSSHYSLA